METRTKKSVKLFQYFMLITLFAAAYLLPAYAARRQAETVGSEVEKEDAAQEGTSGAAENNAGKIVIDPGHGGRQLREIRRKAAAVPEKYLLI